MDRHLFQTHTHTKVNRNGITVCDDLGQEVNADFRVAIEVNKSHQEEVKT